MNALKKQWIFYSVGGLILIGAGLSLTIDAAFYRFGHPENLFWIAYGTLALVVFNSGICLIGQGIICKVRLDDK